MRKDTDANWMPLISWCEFVLVRERRNHRIKIQSSSFWGRLEVHNFCPNGSFYTLSASDGKPCHGCARTHHACFLPSKCLCVRHASYSSIESPRGYLEAHSFVVLGHGLQPLLPLHGVCLRPCNAWVGCIQRCIAFEAFPSLVASTVRFDALHGRS